MTTYPNSQSCFKMISLEDNSSTPNAKKQNKKTQTFSPVKHHVMRYIFRNLNSSEIQYAQYGQVWDFMTLGPTFLANSLKSLFGFLITLFITIEMLSQKKS